jgi:hypothetical protein
VGLSILEVRRFRVAGDLVSVSVYEDGQMEINTNNDSSDEQQVAAEFMLDYLSRLIRSIEETYGSVLQNLKVKVPLTDQAVVKELRDREA